MLKIFIGMLWSLLLKEIRIAFSFILDIIKVKVYVHKVYAFYRAGNFPCCGGATLLNEFRENTGELNNWVNSQTHCHWVTYGESTVEKNDSSFFAGEPMEPP